MKRTIAMLTAALLLLGSLLPGCGQNQSQDPGGSDDATPGGKIKVVCTIYPQYDWVRQILGENAEGFELSLIVSNNIDLHNYQPSVDDIVTISSCDLFIYVGGESDEWVEDALEEALNENMVVVNLLEVLGDAAKEEEYVEGMEPEDEEGDEEEEAYDEHVWMSLRNAQTFCEAIAEAICELDAANAAVYQANLDAYLDELAALDAEYRAAVDAAPVSTLLVADRFPFRYLVDDYDIEYFAAFAGCSAETEASFDTIVFLANKLDELGLTAIVVTESSDQLLAETVRDNTESKDQRIIVLNAIQSVSQSDLSSGLTYISIMRDNLEALKEALY